MVPTPYDKLSPRELDCLRLVAEGLQSKEIAQRLSTETRPLRASTVDGYIKSAMQTLGVSDRRAAARLVAGREGSAPRWLGDGPPGVDPAAPPAPPPAPATSPGRNSFPWPWRRPGEVDNHLDIATRLLWIPLFAIGLAVGFGSLASGLKVVVDLVGSSSLLRASVTKGSDDGRPCSRPLHRAERSGAADACPPVRAAAR